jgi:transposase
VLSIRKIKTASGLTAVQIIYYKNRRVVIEKHIGSGNTNQEVDSLIKKAKEWIVKNSLQDEIFPEKPIDTVSLSDLQFFGVTHTFTYQLLERVARQCGFDINRDRFLFDFAIMRLIEPTSKLRAITLLERYFNISYSKRTVYRRILQLKSRKDAIETIAVKCAKEMLQDDLALVLYDVTTLYFESFKGDELRVEGYSKDNKSQQPQIVVGLIVTCQGFPLGYQVFAGNTFEGKTMLTVLDDFTKKNAVRTPIIVADAAMLSQTNIEELEKRKLSYIVGARLGNTSSKIIEQAYNKLQDKDGKTIRIKTTTGDLIIEFSANRYRKDKHEMEKQIAKAKQLIERSQKVKHAKFIKHKNKDNQYILNETLIEKTKMLLGMKGYCTNIPKTTLSNQNIIKRYHDLWHVEQSFRMAKTDLASRPIFHHKEEAIRSHILICFMALAMGKYLESITEFSLKRIIDAIWIVTDAKIHDTMNDRDFTVRSEISKHSLEIINKLNESLSY